MILLKVHQLLQGLQPPSSWWPPPRCLATEALLVPDTSLIFWSVMWTKLSFIYVLKPTQHDLRVPKLQSTSFVFKYLYPKFPFFWKRQTPKVTSCESHSSQDILFRGPQVNERHDGRVAMEQVLFLYLITPPQYKVPGDYPVTSNLPISKETE